jgi:hypothetical protein
MKVRDSIYNIGNDYPQYVVLRRPTPTPTPGPSPEPTPGTDPIENLDISETVGADGTMTITPNGDTSTLDHYNVNVYGEG